MGTAIKVAVDRDKPVYLEFGINPFSNSERIQIRTWDTFLTLRRIYLNQKWIVLGLNLDLGIGIVNSSIHFVTKFNPFRNIGKRLYSMSTVNCQ